MEYITEDDRELQDLIRKTDAAMANARKPIGVLELKQISQECERNLSQCKQIISRIELETRDMAPDDRQTVRTVLRARATKLKELKNEYKWVQNTAHTRLKQAAEDGDEEVATSSKRKKNIKLDRLDKYEYVNDVDDMGTTMEEKEDLLMQYARDIQKEDMNILDRVIVNVEQTKETATTTAQKVSDQTAQIQRIHDTLGEIDGELDRAKVVLTRIYRRLMTDKIIWFFFGLIALALLVVILLETDVIDTSKSSLDDQTNL